MAKIGFIGLGKLGMPIAEEMGRHHSVFGYDVADKSSSHVMIVDDIHQAVEGSEFIFIAVPTPHDAEYGGELPSSHLPPKDFNYSMLQNVVEYVGGIATEQQTIVVISTCLPGTIRTLEADVTHATLIYNPYFIAMGTVVDDFKNPEFFIIGTSGGNRAIAEPLIDFYKGITNAKDDHLYKVGTWSEAESVKVFYNTFISMKLAFVNMIQDAAMRTFDFESTDDRMEARHVCSILASADQRLISDAYMKPGMGDAGACHPRDLIALSSFAEEFELGYDLFGTVAQVREQQAKNLAKFIAYFGNSQTVCILGIAYKDGVDLTDGSYSLLVAHYLREHDINVLLFDESAPGYGCELPGKDDDAVYLLALPSHAKYTEGLGISATVVDMCDSCNQHNTDAEIIQYGNTKSFI